MQPVKKLAEIAQHEGARKTVKTGSQVFATIRNVAAIGAAAASLATGYFATQGRPSTVDTAQPAPAVIVDPLSIGQVRGKLAFQLDLTPGSTDLAPQPAPTTAAPGAPTPQLSADARPTPDGFEIAAGKGIGYAPMVSRRPAPASYLGEVDLTFAPGTDMGYSWGHRFSLGKQYLLAIDARTELLQFSYQDFGRTTALIPSAIPISGLQKGRVVHLALAVDGPRFLVYLDGDLVADVLDDRLPPPPGATTPLTMGGGGIKGRFTINAVKISALSGPLPAPKKLADPLALANVKGKLIFDTNLTATSTDLNLPTPLPSGAIPSPLPSGAQAPIDVRATPSGVELAVGRGGGFAQIPLRRTAPAQYVAEAEISFASGSDMTFVWNWRVEPTRRYTLSVVSASELLLANFQVLGPQSSSTPLIPSAVPVSGLQTGRTIRLSIAVDGTRHLLYLDGQLVADINDTRLAPTGPVAPLVLGATGTRGKIAVSALRVYGINDPLPTARP